MTICISERRKVRLMVACLFGMLAAFLTGSVAHGDDKTIDVTRLSDIRASVVSETMRRAGRQIMSGAQINAIRRAAPTKNLSTPANFSTCIEFVMQVTSRFDDTRAFRGPNHYRQVDPEAEADLPPDAWRPCTAGETARPKPGDLYVLTFLDDVHDRKDPSRLKYGRGWFSHIGFFLSRTPPPTADARETWVTVDGGTTRAEFSSREFFPETCILRGPNGVRKTLAGWIDLDAFAADKTADQQ